MRGAAFTDDGSRANLDEGLRAELLGAFAQTASTPATAALLRRPGPLLTRRLTPGGRPGEALARAFDHVGLERPTLLVGDPVHACADPLRVAGTRGAEWSVSRRGRVEVRVAGAVLRDRALSSATGAMVASAAWRRAQGLRTDPTLDVITAVLLGFSLDLAVGVCLEHTEGECRLVSAAGELGVGELVYLGALWLAIRGPREPDALARAGDLRAALEREMQRLDLGFVRSVIGISESAGRHGPSRLARAILRLREVVRPRCGVPRGGEGHT